MGKPAKYLAVYDVTQDRERNALADLLEGFGIRVQKSAFECDLTRGSRATLERKLRTLELKSGYVFLYRVQAQSARLAFGTVPDNPVDDSHYAFVL